ncbi:VOC family protein [Pseudalkalibacillus caeni]|uniref:Glutathione transferase n=1 Tax=Exobacillus caeni TaxID=2574798 RepID=A0A5R9F6N4_9BACL|nr:VOC family protein [Pseudalkalibacillus caeni]TLS38006.1 glutathione transferase [Pseudalkalibacillus caeni]
MKVKGFSHVTIRVSDLNRSLQFYQDCLEMKVVHKGRRDAYLEWGTAWICLVESDILKRTENQAGVDHVAFYIEEENFEDAVNKLIARKVTVARMPVKRGQGMTFNFLDPDGTQLELHTGTLKSRMEVWV